MWLGVDTGGTFTDFLLFDGQGLRVHKVLSTPRAPEQAILQGIDELGLNQPEILSGLSIVHGSTVATNAALEGKGVRTVYIANRGLKDLLTIGRQNRAELYNLQPQPKSPPVPAELCLETGGRLSAEGEVVEPLTDDDLHALREAVEALAPESVAINLLFSFIDDCFEKAIEAAMPEGVFVSRSSDVLPEYREYERGVATWLNAWVGPLMQRYLARLKQGVNPARVSVMQSSGGTIDIDQAGAHAVRLLLSGPAGGMAAAKFIGGLAGCERLLTFDMGGTSTDVAMIDGEIALTSEGHIGPYPVAVPMVDMHTIGAGGGSIASVDAGGMLQVGPESAGASPGPVCYGQGGERITVTDANLILGRLRPELFLGGNMSLDVAAAERAMDRLAEQLGVTREEAAEGVIRVANEHMARALRVMSVQRGVDPRGLTLTSFGGAGGLHVCALADALGMERALVPIHSGVLSALGMLVAPKVRQFSRTVNRCIDELPRQEADQIFSGMIEQGQQELQAEGVTEADLQIKCSADMRYHGQSFTLNIPWGEPNQMVDRFHALHEQRFGHALAFAVEVVNLRVEVSSHSHPIAVEAAAEQIEGEIRKVACYGVEQPVEMISRQQLSVAERRVGPMLVIDPVSTTFVTPDWACCKDRYGNLLLEKVAV